MDTVEQPNEFEADELSQQEMDAVNGGRLLRFKGKWIINSNPEEAPSTNDQQDEG